jgi:hypothetical protein
MTGLTLLALFGMFTLGSSSFIDFQQQVIEAGTSLTILSGLLDYVQ